MIYFIRNTETGRVKIGYSRSPFVRFDDLQSATDCELKLLGCISGGIKREHQIHDSLSECRVRGEWFAGTMVDSTVRKLLEEAVQQDLRGAGARPDPTRVERRREEVQRVVEALAERDWEETHAARERMRIGARRARGSTVETVKQTLARDRVAAEIGMSGIKYNQARWLVRQSEDGNAPLADFYMQGLLPCRTAYRACRRLDAAMQAAVVAALGEEQITEGRILAAIEKVLARA